jgi:hypothetical protein
MTNVEVARPAQQVHAEAADRLAESVMLGIVRQLSCRCAAEPATGRAQGVMPELRDLLEGNQVDAADQLVTGRRGHGAVAPSLAGSVSISGVVPVPDGLMQLVARLLPTIWPVLGRGRREGAGIRSGAACRLASGIARTTTKPFSLEQSL